jgi:hypothetical protein
VPLFAREGVPIGVVCVLDSQARKADAEDLLILEQLGRQGSLLLQMLALGREENELPGRYGAGMVLRPTLEVMVDAELRLLRQYGGSLSLALIELNDVEPVRQRILHASSRERLGPRRVAIYKRDRADGAGAFVSDLVHGVEAAADVDAVGEADIAGTQLPGLGGPDLVRLAELGLQQALDSGGRWDRLVLRHEALPPMEPAAAH